SHLLEAAAAQHALPRDQAEAAATAGFGVPAEVARGFAEDLGVRTASRATLEAAVAVVMFAAAFLVMASGGVQAAAPWLLSSPSWPLAFFGAQVTAAATLITAVRVLAGGWPPRPGRAADIARGAVVASASGVISLGAVVGALIAHGAGSVWPLALLLAAAAGLAASGLACLAAVRALAHARQIEPAQPPPFEGDLAGVLGLVRAQWPAELLAKRPWSFCVAFGVLAGAAVAAGHAIGDGGPSISAGALAAAAVLTAIELVAVAAGFATLGRWLRLWRPSADRA
ncbi:MAG: hypothetical protein ACJ76V_13085, partial [Thermoleophilaceae bacterium]